MTVSDCVRCEKFPCAGVKHECFIVPDVEFKPESIIIIMISEAAPEQATDYYYAGGESLFAQTTLKAFNDAGAQVTSIEELLQTGIYLTTAVKCGKTGYGIEKEVIEQCSHLLEQELALFPNVKVLMLMGDVAIKAINSIAKRSGEPRVISVGATYKLRGQMYSYHGARVFPSYLQAGPSFFIEKSKRRMIAEDIVAALKVVR